MTKRTTDIVTRIVPPFGAPYVFILAVIQGTDRHAVYRLTKKETIIGADPDLADFALNDSQVSSRHAMIRVNGNMVSLIDKDSTNGTILNENPVSPGKPNRLKPGDEITIGRTRLIFMSSKFRD